MKAKLLLAALATGYFGLAYSQDGPVQIWLAALAPLVFVLVGFVLDVVDSR
jgi:hypothetical protein